VAPSSKQWPTRMNATDALFWALESVPELRSTTGALAILERPPAPERLREEFQRMVARVPRLRQRVVETPFDVAPPEWCDDADFDLDYHLRTIAVPAPGGMAQLLDELGPLFATPLDRDRPLWEAYHTDGLSDGRAAVFFKMHHCLIDGVGGTELMTDLFGDRRQHDDPVPAAPPPVERSMAPGARLARGVLHNLRDTLGVTATMAGALLEAGRHPLDAALGLGAGGRRLLGLGRDLGTQRAESPLHHRRSLSRRLSTFDMYLAEIDAVRAELGATNNDVILTIVSGALHRWHTSRGADVRELHVLVPVSLRTSEDDAGGNRIALLALGLPVGEPNPLTRLRIIQRNMGRVKADRRATLYPVAARVIRALPAPLVAALMRQQTRRTNLVCTNVPGPRHTCFLAGQAIERFYAYAPLVGDHPIAIALYSYRDMVHVGLDVDPLAMGDLDHFRDALDESYAEVLNVGRATPVPLRRSV
jgi:diacylglycerol O-acyltransferase / wax synthase